jgi:hypothetical protein
MMMLSPRLAQSFPASVARNRSFRSKFRQLPSIEFRVLLIALAMSICLLVYAPIGQHRSLNERAMLSAMLAAGGMPLVYLRRALCTSPDHRSRFDRSELLALFRK